MCAQRCVVFSRIRTASTVCTAVVVTAVWVAIVVVLRYSELISSICHRDRSTLRKISVRLSQELKILRESQFFIATIQNTAWKQLPVPVLVWCPQLRTERTQCSSTTLWLINRVRCCCSFQSHLS